MRRYLPRVLGMAVAAAVLAAATQLLLLSFERSPLVGDSLLGDTVAWIERRPTEGAAILAGAALILAAVTLGWLALRPEEAQRPTLTTRQKDGWTKIDRATLSDAITRQLEPIDRRTEPKVSISRKGRVDLTLDTVDPTLTGSSSEYSEALLEICEDRGLPCTPGRLTMTTNRSTSRRTRIR